jgi:hypothetical protein
VSLRGVILATVFLGGAAIMSLELAGVRLIQPDFGSDLDVWGAMISVFLGGMAIGAVLGGRLADKWPSLVALSLVFFIAGGFTLTLPVIGRPIKDWTSPSSKLVLPPRPGDSDAAEGDSTGKSLVTGKVATEAETDAILGKDFRPPADWDHSQPEATPNTATTAATDSGGISRAATAAPVPETRAERPPDRDAGGSISTYQPPSYRWPTLLAGAILFGLPSILLGMVSPFSARLYVQALGQMGAGVGQVYGISTAGSIVGTLCTAFYLIGWLGTKWLLITNGLTLVGLGMFLAVAALLLRKPKTA